MRITIIVLYEIILAEAGMFLVEASAIVRLLSFLKKVGKIDAHCWPSKVVDGELAHQKKTWKKQKDKWLNKWNIQYQECLENNFEKKWVAEKIKSTIWANQLGRKKMIEFNPVCEHDDKEYLVAEIKGKAKILITQL